MYAIDASKGNMSRLADLQYARFGLQLVGLPGGDFVAVGGGQHVNNTEVASCHTACNLLGDKEQIILVDVKTDTRRVLRMGSHPRPVHTALRQ